MIVYAACHSNRRLVRDGMCRECAQVASTPADDPLPAMIAGTVQQGGPEMPPCCGKCGGLWADRGAYLACPYCGSTWHRTSTRIIAQPTPTQAPAHLLAQITGRADRKR